MAIVTDDVSLLVDFTRDKKKLKDGLDSLRKKAKSGRFGRSEQYSLTYYPTNTRRDGKLRRVEIKVRNHPEYVIWGKKSYYAESQ